MSLDNELLPSLRDGLDSTPRKKGKKDAATGAYAAGMRAMSARLLTFYFRAPVKAFFRTRVEYVITAFKWDLPTIISLTCP